MSDIITINEENYEEITKNGIIVVDFYADWCGPCKMMAPILEETSEEYKGKVVFGKLDTDANQNIAMANRIMSIPTFFFFKDGELVERVTGMINKDALCEKLDALI